MAGNGLFELFAVDRSNELDYDQFYARIDNKKVFDLLHQLIQTPEAKFVNTNPEGIEQGLPMQAKKKD